MKKPARTIDKGQVNKAIAFKDWDLANEVLYELCDEHRDHTNVHAIAAKVWLIGRSYAASVERYKRTNSGDQDFFMAVLAPHMKKSPLDKWLSRLPHGKGHFLEHHSEVVETHGLFMSDLTSVLTKDARSFASKYLHFHRPLLFPIYDSRAVIAVKKLSPDCRFLPRVFPKGADIQYAEFCMRAARVLKDVETTHQKLLSTRQLDNLFLYS